MAHKMSKRVLEAHKRRALIMSTAEFQIWWEARRAIHPIPSDPFRAFMIDRGLRARPLDKETWQPRTNRSDLIPVDNPHARHGRRLPKGHRYIPHSYRPNYVPFSARPTGKLTEEEKALKAHVEKMAAHYHTAVPDVVFERGTGEAISAMYQGGNFAGDLKPFMRIGTKGLNKKTLPKFIAVVSHEMGHHVHKRGAEKMLTTQGHALYDRADRVEKEKIAWSIADPFMKQGRPVQKWTKKHYLGTYLRTSGHGKRGVDWDRHSGFKNPLDNIRADINGLIGERRKGKKR